MAREWLRRPEEWGVAPVPQERRRLRAVDLGILWFSLGVGLLVLFAGALLVLAFGLSLFEVLLVGIAGSVIGSLMLAAAGRPGSHHGVPTMVSLRPVLGRKASWIPSAINSFQLLGWAAFELMIMGLGLTLLSGPLLGDATPVLWIAVLATWVTLLALGGPLVVVRVWLEKVAVWLVLGSTLWLTAVVVTDPAFATRFFEPMSTGDRPLGLALDLVIAMPISWWPLVADYNRFARRPRDSFLGTFAGYTLSNSWFYFLGAAVLVVFGLAGEASGPVAFVRGITGTVLGSLVLLLIIVDETDNAFANIYSTAVSLQNVAPRRRQVWFILAATGIATAGAWVLLAQGQGIGGGYELFLLLIGGLFVPLLGTVIADAFVVRRLAYRDAEFGRAAPRVRWPAVASWAAGILLYFAIAYGLIPAFPPIGATLPSFLLAAMLQILFARAAAVGSGRPAPGGGPP